MVGGPVAEGQTCPLTSIEMLKGVARTDEVEGREGAGWRRVRDERGDGVPGIWEEDGRVELTRQNSRSPDGVDCGAWSVDG